jgi:hypothetical protein
MSEVLRFILNERVRNNETPQGTPAQAGAAEGREGGPSAHPGQTRPTPGSTLSLI